ncbi:MAG: hypothetical protein M5R40_17415 [Anaerolineae bacterium]|nr:hypothetical protein [Anaerolineae bacterium]
MAERPATHLAGAPPAGQGRSARRFPLWLLPLGLIVPVAAGALAAAGGFDGLYGQDPFAYYGYAAGPLRAQFFPPPPFAWPPGYPWLVVAAMVVVGVRPLAGQLVSLVAGGLVVVFTILLAWEVWGRDDDAPRWLGPLVAGLAAAGNGQLLQSSAMVMSDTAALAAATLGAWALARYSRPAAAARAPRRLRWLLLAAGAVAYAVITRWAYGLVAIVCAGVALIVLRRACRASPLAALAHGGAAGLLTLALLAPVVAPALGSFRAPVGEPTAFAVDLQVYSWDPRNALRSAFANSDGHLSYRLPNGLYYAAAPARSFYFTPLWAAFIIPGVWAVVRRRALVATALLIGWPALVYAFLSGAPWQNFRFTLTYMPPLAALTGIGVTYLWRRCDGRRWQRAAIAGALGVGLVWMAASGATLTQGFTDRKHDDLATVRWVEMQAPADARVITLGLTPLMQYYSALEAFDLYALSEADLAALFASERPAYLLLDVANVETQWRGRTPQETYHRLRDGPGLAAVGQRGPYTLFRVGR